MRLFIAIRFDDKIINVLTALQQDLSEAGVKGHFSTEENLHLTLAFIGDYGNPDDVLDAMGDVEFEPFRIELDGIGCFGDTYWAGIKENEDLAKYVKRLRRALSDADIPFDRKRFSPHITIVRKAVYQGGTGLPAVNPDKASTTVDSISLMRSDRGKHGMIYTEIGTIC